MCVISFNLTLTLREEHNRLKVFENRVLRIIYGPKRDEIIGRCRKLHNLYSSPNITRMIMSRRMRCSGLVACMGRRGMHLGFWWESQKERDHQEVLDVGGRITKINLREIRWGGMDWMYLAQDRDQ
jgi:hypothetical protein